MPFRIPLLTLVALAVAAPNAEAAIADRFMPVRDASDGVTATANAFKFGPKAAKLYRGLAGKKAFVGCGDPTVKYDGTYSAGADPDGQWSGVAGYAWTEKTLPRKRGRVKLDVGHGGDVCFIATKETRRDGWCLPIAERSEGMCVRVLVTRTDKGRAGIDERSRSIELDLVFGAAVDEIQQQFGASSAIALDSPDASPPVGSIGVFQNETTTATVAVLADGRRLFVRQDGDVYTTNVPALGGQRRLGSLV